MDGDRLAKLLIAGLTSKQLTHVLARLLNRTSEPACGELCDELDEDSAAVLRELLTPRPTGQVEPAETTSDARFAEEFGAVTRDLQALALEIGDEEGKYVCQEHHWEAPDFDAGRLADDIERCTERMLPLLERAAGLELEDEAFFADLFDEFSEAIASYPEWIYTEEGVSLERTATDCVLKWLDLHAGTEAELLGKLIGFLARAVSVVLDRSAIQEYLVSSWPDSRRSRLYEAIRHRRSSDEAFRQDTDTPRTLWHETWYELAGEFDTKAQTRIAEVTVGKDWPKGVALVDAAMAEGNSTRALEYCRETVDSFFRNQNRPRDNTGFDPATTPLFGYLGMSGESTTVSRVIELWAQLAREKHDPSLAELLGIQGALFDRAADWTAVRRAFHAAESADATALFDAWKERTLRDQGSSYGFQSVPQPGWVEWLIDAGFANRWEAFADRAAAWFRGKAQDEESPSRSAFGGVSLPAWPDQMSLAADLLAIEREPAKHPALRTVVLEQCSLNECSSRLEWLEQTEVHTLTADAVNFVRRSIAHLIPSPEAMSGDYASPAAWLAACREIAPDVARRTLGHWRTQYKRRRNLWRDLRTHDFDV